MKILIDISESQFADIQRIASVQLKNRLPTVEQIIASGTPLKRIVNSQPTIEPKKGRWITKSTNGEMFDCCSACGYVEWDEPKNFCPNCGADMRGEAE